jgi:hypothetical protein
VDVMILDEGRGVIPLRGRGSDPARALPHSTAMFANAEKCVEALGVHGGSFDLDGVVVALEAGPWKTAMGHPRVFDAGVRRMNRRGRKKSIPRVFELP